MPFGVEWESMPFTSSGGHAPVMVSTTVLLMDLGIHFALYFAILLLLKWSIALFTKATVIFLSCVANTPSRILIKMVCCVPKQVVTFVRGINDEHACSRTTKPIDLYKDHDGEH
jgi:hypothetical protein